MWLVESKGLYSSRLLAMLIMHRASQANRELAPERTRENQYLILLESQLQHIRNSSTRATWSTPLHHWPLTHPHPKKAPPCPTTSKSAITTKVELMLMLHTEAHPPNVSAARPRVEVSHPFPGSQRTGCLRPAATSASRRRVLARASG